MASDSANLYNPLLRPLSAQAFGTPLNDTPYDSNGGFIVPTKYVHTLQDKSVPVWVQEQVISAASNRTNWCGKVDFNTDHLFTLQEPDKAAYEIKKFIEEVSN